MDGCGSTEETLMEKHLNGKLENPAEMEVERTLKSTGWLGRLCSMEVARWCFGNGWQDLLRAVLPWFFGLKIHFQAEQKPFRLHNFASLNHPSISVLSNS